jgi:hypothetical protein
MKILGVGMGLLAIGGLLPYGYLGVTICLLGWWFYSRRDTRAQRRAKRWKTYLETDIMEDRVSKSSHAAALHCKVKFGLMSNSRANQMVVSEEVRRFMRDELKMRPTAIVREYPRAVALTLMAMKWDSKSREVLELTTEDNELL